MTRVSYWLALSQLLTYFLLICVFPRSLGLPGNGECWTCNSFAWYTMTAQSLCREERDFLFTSCLYPDSAQLYHFLSGQSANKFYSLTNMRNIYTEEHSPSVINCQHLCTLSHHYRIKQLKGLPKIPGSFDPSLQFCSLGWKGCPVLTLKKHMKPPDLPT